MANIVVFSDVEMYLRTCRKHCSVIQLPIVFGDMRQGYAILERPGIGVLRDMYSNKPYIGLYSIKRVGGLVQDYRALKVLCVAVTSA